MTGWPWDFITELYRDGHPAARLTLHSEMFSSIWPGVYRFGLRRVRRSPLPPRLNRFVDWSAEPEEAGP